MDPALPTETDLYRSFAPRVRLYGLRHLRDRAAADDLVQHVLMIVIDALRAGRVRDPASLGGFVLGTARRVAGDWAKTERRRGELLARFPLELDGAPAEAAPLDDARLRGCLDALAERERMVVVATFYGDERGPALARRLGLDDGHVRVIRHRAVARLQRCMGDEVIA
ncbi:MAG: sigma-70 family RNA polymerase sigma factor [Myxococcota bacterium]